MRQIILHSDMSVDQCRTQLSDAAAPWPGYWEMALKSAFKPGSQKRIVAKQIDNKIVLAILRYGYQTHKRGIGFRLISTLSEEVGSSGTRLHCYLQNGLVWRASGTAAIVMFMAFLIYKRTGHLISVPGFWFFSLFFVFLGVVMPSLLWADDGPVLITFLKRTLDAYDLKSEQSI